MTVLFMKLGRKMFRLYKFVIVESVWFAKPELSRRELFVLRKARMVVLFDFTKIPHKKFAVVSIVVKGSFPPSPA
jgi:hypothetical protein